MDAKNKLKFGDRFLYRAGGSEQVLEGRYGGESPTGQFVNVNEGRWLAKESLQVVEVLPPPVKADAKPANGPGKPKPK